MGAYDNIDPERLKADLVRFAELIHRLDEEDAVLVSPSDLLTILGDLRQKLFAYEVRCSHLLGEDRRSGTTETDTSDPEPDSLRIVREAIERNEELVREWRPPSDGEPEHDG